jgi:hypothetical protein
MQVETRRTIATGLSIAACVGVMIGWIHLAWYWVPHWNARRASPVPREFSYLMFPSEYPNTQLLDQAGDPVMALRVAVLVTDEQLKAGKLVDPGLANGRYRVDLSKLSFIPPAGAPDLVEAWASDLAARQYTLRDPSFTVSRENGRTRVTLGFGPGAPSGSRFVYDMDGASAVPVEMNCKDERGWAMGIGFMMMIPFAGLMGTVYRGWLKVPPKTCGVPTA